MQHVFGAGFHLRVREREFLNLEADGERTITTIPNREDDEAFWALQLVGFPYKQYSGRRCAAYAFATPTLTACFFFSGERA